MSNKPQPRQLFDFVKSHSSLMLPAVLDSVVHLPAAMCGGDGCSIFLKAHRSGEPVLCLAATTRRELRSKLFDPSTHYSLDRSNLVLAARKYREIEREVRLDYDVERQRTGGIEDSDEEERLIRRRIDEKLTSGVGIDAGLTAWVGVYLRPLRIRDLTVHPYGEEEEGTEGSDSYIPPPVWSDKTRGFFDWAPPRPYLAVPCIDHNQRLQAVVRVTTIRDRASEFTKKNQRDLEEFGEALANFISHKELEDEGEALRETPLHAPAFRTWADHEDGDLIDQVTRGATELFDFIDACSFFRREGDHDFVLKSTHASEEAIESAGNRDTFTKFRSKIGTPKPPLYQPAVEPPQEDEEEGKKEGVKEQGVNKQGEPGEEEEWQPSKTSYCLLRQEPLLMFKGGEGWELDSPPPDSKRPVPVFKDGASPGSGGDDNTCELNHKETRAILFAPVRDKVNPRRLAGVLRAIIAKDLKIDQYRRALVDLNQFAFGLADRLGGRRESEISEKLTQQLARADRSELARIVAEGIEADAVTLFFNESPKGESAALTSDADLSFLNKKQIKELCQGPELEELERQHMSFQRSLQSLRYVEEEGVGRTLTVFLKRQVLRLKRRSDSRELKSLGVQQSAEQCELKGDGSFIAAPLMLGGECVGVVRALRVQKSLEGPFTLSHEMILKTVTPILAERIEKPRSVTISYGFDRYDLLEVLRDYLGALGLESRYCEPGSRSSQDFITQLRGSGTMILIATRRGSGKQVSANVSSELTLLMDPDSGRVVRDVIVLKEKGVRLPALAPPEDGSSDRKGAKPKKLVQIVRDRGKRYREINFDRASGILPALISLTRELRSFGLIGRPERSVKEGEAEEELAQQDVPLPDQPRATVVPSAKSTQGKKKKSAKG